MHHFLEGGPSTKIYGVFLHVRFIIFIYLFMCLLNDLFISAWTQGLGAF